MYTIQRYTQEIRGTPATFISIEMFNKHCTTFICTNINMYNVYGRYIAYTIHYGLMVFKYLTAQ